MHNLQAARGLLDHPVLCAAVRAQPHPLAAVQQALEHGLALHALQLGAAEPPALTSPNTATAYSEQASEDLAGSAWQCLGKLAACTWAQLGRGDPRQQSATFGAGRELTMWHPSGAPEPGAESEKGL